MVIYWQSTEVKPVQWRLRISDLESHHPLS
jgi:hypothetical protein